MSVYLAVLIAFYTLLATEAIGTWTFLGLYLLRSDWRDNPVSRHLVFYAAALSGLYVVTFALMVWPRTWLMAAMLIGHLCFDAAIWQRVYLLVREQRHPPEGEEGTKT